MPDARASTKAHLLALAALVTLAGCLGAGPDEAVDATGETVDDLNPLTEADANAEAPQTDTESSYPRCQHPWPCGNGAEWPANLTGPFDLLEVERVNVSSFDGTRLHGYLLRPDAPDGVEVPVVLGSTPYQEFYDQKPGDPAFAERSQRKYGIDLTEVAEQGYAVAIFDVRGTGDSGGCPDYFGPDEKRDQKIIVDWLGNRSWSNGRVAMMGLSWRAATAWQAAVQSPGALKTTVTAGIVTNWYTFLHTPQGASYTPGPFQAALAASLVGPPIRYPGPQNVAEWGTTTPERACPTFAESASHPGPDVARDDRDADYWEPRRIIDEVPNVTAATLLTHGFHDNTGHAFQESAVWHTLPDDTPKHMIQGTWSHEFPRQNDEHDDVHDGETLPDWKPRLMTWLDFWLKGRGEVPEELGTVQYQDHTHEWHNTTAWPPAEATPEVLHLTPDGLSPEPAEGSVTFRSRPAPLLSQQASRTIGPSVGDDPGPVCAPGPLVAEPPLARFVSDPVEQDTLVAGNPFAHLDVSASQPGGLLQVAVLEFGPNFRCDEQGIPRDAAIVTLGRADLRFHEGGYTGQPFPTDEPTRVRIDLKDDARVIEAGNRAGAWLSYGDAERAGQPHTPQITVHGDSELVLPVVEGTLGGYAPEHEYPPRPFVREG